MNHFLPYGPNPQPRFRLARQSARLETSGAWVLWALSAIVVSVFMLLLAASSAADIGALGKFNDPSGKIMKTC